MMDGHDTEKPGKEAKEKSSYSLLYDLVNNPELNASTFAIRGQHESVKSQDTGWNQNLVQMNDDLHRGESHPIQSQSQSQGQTQVKKRLHDFITQEKKLRELLLGKEQTQPSADSTKNRASQSVESAQIRNQTSMPAVLLKQTSTPAQPLSRERVQMVVTIPKGMAQSHVVREESPPKKMKPTNRQGGKPGRGTSVASTSAAKEQDTERKNDPSLCSTSRWQHNTQNADAGSSLLEEVLTEKKMQLMQSPEVIQWLQEQQLLVRKRKLLNVLTMPINNLSENYPTAAASTQGVSSQGTASTLHLMLSDTSKEGVLHQPGQSHLDNSAAQSNLNPGEGHPAGGQGHDLPQGLDPEQQNRTGIWSREASAFMSVSRIRNSDAS